jgi:hypothetical protein
MEQIVTCMKWPKLVHEYTFVNKLVHLGTFCRLKHIEVQLVIRIKNLSTIRGTFQNLKYLLW